MDCSESIPASLTCPACGRTFTADLWLIVDAAARPDLIDRLRNGTLHRLACPHCGNSVDIDAPLLVYVPPTADADARLIFSPARSTSVEEDQRHAVELLTRLRNASGDAWRDEWLERITNARRELLPLALSDDLEQAVRRLADLLEQFINARTWDESRRILEQHPELFSPVADMLLERLSAAFRAQGDENAQRILEEHRALLRRCRKVGIEQAFAEKTTTPAPSGITAESANLPPEIAQALREVLEQLAVAGVEVRSPEDLEQALQEHPDLLEKLMRAAADAGGLVVPPAFAADVQIAAEALVRYERSSDIEALDEAVAAWERILNHAEFGRTEQWFCRIVLNNAGGAYLRRYWRQGRVSDLNSALHLWETALSTSSSDISVRSAILNNLGNGLRARYARTGNLADLDTAIARFEEALVAVPFDTPGRPKILNNLGNGLRDRYARTGNPADLDTAIARFEEALVAAPFDAPDRPAILNGLGNGLRDRYARTGNPADLDTAIARFEEALVAAPFDAPDRPVILNNLGNGLRDRYARTGNLADLNAAIAHYEKALAVTPPDDPDRPSRVNNLGNGLRDRYVRTGNLADLNAAIAHYENALAAAPSGAPDRPMYLNNLGTGLRDRYACTGNLADLDAAIARFEEALAATPLDAPDRSSRLSNLGNGLRARYARTGNLADLDAAIARFEEALAATPPDAPDRSSRLNNLGTGLRDRYARTGNLADLNAAIALFEEALATAPPDALDRPIYLNNLGTGLRDRYTRSGNLADLNEAIMRFEEARDATPSDAPRRAAILNNLGNELRIRYVRTGNLADLDVAIKNFEDALKATPPDAPERSTILNNLGNRLRDRYARTSTRADLQAAQEAFRTACVSGLETSLEDVLRAGRNWGDWTFNRHAWDETVAAYTYAMQAVRRLFAIQYRREEKLLWLRDAQEVPVRLAYAFIQQRQPEQALSALETGRARLLREALEQNRRDLSRLPAMGFADLLSAYLRARQEYSDLLVLAQSETRPPSWHTRIEAARQALSDAGRAIREQAGVHDPAFRSFMSDPTFPDIQSIAQIAPLVYLLATPVGGAALIVHAGGVQAVDLPELTEAALNGWLVETDAEGKNVTGGYLPAQLAVTDWMPAALARLLPELGAKVMGPVLDALTLPSGPLPSPALREREEGEAGANTIILIPTGRLALLPLHAAQLPDGTHVIDHVTVCYAPSALALREARRHAAERRAAPLRLAGVGNPLPPVAALAELHQQLLAAAAALPDDPAAKELRSLVALPTGQLIHEGFELQRQIRELPDAWGDAVQQLRQLAAQWPSSLRYAKAELDSVIDLLPASAATALYEQSATLAALRERMDGATALHLSCHGVFRADDPLELGLLLYNAAGQEERLTLRDLLDMEQTTLRHTRLATLSACQTAITDFRNLPEELIGLPAGFLQAGVPGVIGTLWSVDDAATALLVTRIYEYMQQEGLPAARAVRRAQRWLRDVTAAELETYLERHEAIARARLESGRRMPVTLIEELFGKVTTAENPQQERPYASPNYWAPFTFTGAEEVRL
ncbi:MAG: CHAT domain-containing protein [Roseiflexaceae bacterium]|nr:CHAT domain-containing protein [Roseiflexaceae bacterium]